MPASPRVPRIITVLYPDRWLLIISFISRQFSLFSGHISNKLPSTTGMPSWRHIVLKDALSLYFNVKDSDAPKRSAPRVSAASVSICPENHGTYTGFLPVFLMIFLIGSGLLTISSERVISLDRVLYSTT